MLSLLAAPASAAAPTDSDLRISTDHGSIVKGYITVRLHLYNYGPAGTNTGDVTLEFTAPPGTVIYDPHGSFAGPNCHWITAGKHVRCTSFGQYWSNYNGYGDYGGSIDFKVVSTVTGTGLYKVYCTSGTPCHDPVMTNNEAKIIVNGAVYPTPTPKATPTRKPKPKPTPTPTPTPAATPTKAMPAPTLSDTVEPTPSTSPTPLTLAATEQDRSGSALPWLSGGLVVLAALIAVTLWRTGRRRAS
jgi:cell division septation protein DedD